MRPCYRATILGYLENFHEFYQFSISVVKVRIGIVFDRCFDVRHVGNHINTQSVQFEHERRQRWREKYVLVEFFVVFKFSLSLGER